MPASEINNSDRYWKPKQAASHLRISVATLYQWLNPKTPGHKKSFLKGDVPPHIRFSRNCIRFPVEEFMQWAGTYRGKDF